MSLALRMFAPAKALANILKVLAYATEQSGLCLDEAAADTRTGVT